MKTNKLLSILMMLVLVFGTAISFSSCGDDDDDYDNPTPQGNTVDMSKIIGNWAVDSDSYQELFSFHNDKKAYYEYDNLDDNNWEAVLAEGNYTVNGNVITVNFNDVSVYSDGNKKVMGFTNKTNITVKYTITKIEESGKETCMTLVNGINGKTLLVYKY